MVFALPGLAPAVVMLVQSPSRELSLEADRIQVFFRLDHHLNPRSFPVAAYAGYVALIFAWLLLRRAARFLIIEGPAHGGRVPGTNAGRF